MLNNILNIQEYKPHLSGEIKCMNCGHKWIGVSPLLERGEIDYLECPNCHFMKGYYNYPIEPKDGEIIFKCPCGGECFTLMVNGARCMQCGCTTELSEVYEEYNA